MTCYFWAANGHCSLPADECSYAHHHTGQIAPPPPGVRQPAHPNDILINGRGAHNPTYGPPKYPMKASAPLIKQPATSPSAQSSLTATTGPQVPVVGSRWGTTSLTTDSKRGMNAHLPGAIKRDHEPPLQQKVNHDEYINFSERYRCPDSVKPPLKLEIGQSRWRTPPLLYIARDEQGYRQGNRGRPTSTEFYGTTNPGTSRILSRDSEGAGPETDSAGHGLPFESSIDGMS